METPSFLKQLRIEKVIEETAEARTFVLKPLGWDPVYVSGQFLTLVFNTPHGEKRRSYSVSSCPELGEPLQITVKKVDNGEFSRRLVYEAKAGDILLCSGISGFFVLPENISFYEQVWFLAAGSGITPCFALIKTLLYTTDREVILVYSNRNRGGAIFMSQIEQLQQMFPGRFRTIFLFSELRDVYKSRLSNWLLPQLMSQIRQADPMRCLFYLCGPFDYMKMAEITLLSKFPRQNLRKEHFVQYPRLVLPEPPDRAAHRVHLQTPQGSYELQVKYPVSLLAQAKKQQIELPYSCEAGRCGSCIATCTQGKMWMAYNEVLTDREVSEGRILMCQAFAVGGDASVTV